jgi:cell division protein FtsL
VLALEEFMETVLLFLSLAALALAAVFIRRGYKAGRRVDDLEAKLTAKDREISGLRQEVLRLSPYQAVIDAHAASDSIRAAAEASRVGGRGRDGGRARASR